MSLVVKYPDRSQIIPALIALAQEELEHFGQVFEQMRRRGLSLVKDEPDPYVNRLVDLMRHGREERFLDRMLILLNHRVPRGRALRDHRQHPRGFPISPRSTEPCGRRSSSTATSSPIWSCGTSMRTPSMRDCTELMAGEAEVVQTLQWRRLCTEPTRRNVGGITLSRRGPLNRVRRHTDRRAAETSVTTFARTWGPESEPRNVHRNIRMLSGKPILFSLALALGAMVAVPTDALAVPPPHAQKHVVKDEKGRDKLTAIQKKKHQYAIYDATGEYAGFIQYLGGKKGGPSYYRYYNENGQYTGYSRD